MKHAPNRLLFSILLLAASCGLNPTRSAAQHQHAAESSKQPELTRPVRPWEFLDAVGQRAALLGRESGEMEGWIYPLKVFRGFQLRFHTATAVLPAHDLARQLIVHPEGPAIVYSTASFKVHETFLVPPTEPGAIIRLDIDTFEPLQIEAEFLRDFQLM